MKRIIVLIAVSFVCFSLSAQTREQRLSNHVYFLASDDMHGREAGSEDAARAREYIIAEFENAGLKPYIANGWEVPVMQGKYTNVVGVIEGSDPVLKKEYIVLGAHYDHLGVRNGKVYNGADDNASGTAALIEVAKYLSSCRDQLKRSVIIAAFDAEELGLYGSRELAAMIRVNEGASNIKLMMSIDMVGWLKANGNLTLEGVATIKNGMDLLQAQADVVQLPIKGVKFEKSIFTATDTEYFAKEHIPTLAVTTGIKSPYHKPEDDPELIDYPGLDRVTEYIGNVALECAKDPAFSGSGKVAAKHRDSARPLVVGLTGGAGSSYIDFRNAGFTGKTAFSANIGAVTRITFDKKGTFALQAECDFEQAKAWFPDESNLFSSSLKYVRRSLVVPVQFLFHTPQDIAPIGTYLGLGGFWSKSLYESLSAPRELYGDGYGFVISFGFDFGAITFQFDSKMYKNKLFTGADAPNSKLQTNVASLKYFF